MAAFIENVRRLSGEVDITPGSSLQRLSSGGLGSHVGSRSFSVGRRPAAAGHDSRVLSQVAG